MEEEELVMELDTEELEYSELSGRNSTREDGGSDATSDSEADEEIPTLSTLQPYETTTRGKSKTWKSKNNRKMRNK